MQCHLIPQGLIFKKMPFSMELPIFSSNHSLASRVSLRPFVSTCVLYSSFLRYKKFGEKLSCSSRPPLRISMCVLKDCCSLSGDLKGDREVVEVIGIGSRKDAVIDFCLNSNFQSASLRFWNILVKDSLRVELHQRLNGKDVTAKIVEPSHFIQSCSKTVILVASAGYDLDHSAAIDILKTVRSANGLVVAIVLKPFSFEGRRRLDEVKDLAGKLQDHINFCIDVDTDKLLKKDLVTLDEALRTANNAVLLAINAVAVLPSGVQKQFLDAHNNFKELKISDIVKILEGYKEAKVGFGVGHDIKASILQAIYDCPFIGAGIKDLNGIIIFIFASPNLVENNNAQAVLETFRRITDYKGQIIISTIHEPNLEPNELITTVVILSSSCLQQEPPQEGRILSRLARHFPFFFNLLRRYHPQPNASKGNNMPKDVYPSAMINSKKSSEVESRIDLEGIAESFNNYSEELQAVSSDSYSDDYASSEADQSEVGLLESMKESFNFYDEITEGSPAFLREQAISWNLGPGDEIAQQWAKKREAESGDSPALDSLSIFSLPVGVRPSEELKDGFRIFAQCLEPITEDDVKAQRLVNSNKAMKDVYDTASTLLKGKYADTPKKQGNLSVRAASMLENERDSPKKWSPILEMQYRGGAYRGRCQGGLPEGKGRLVLGDGSIYDGMWRYGKKSGLGTFYFINGDVFQGTWRDDVMHGKGWFYFHTGDRWFANFWKGKANGESRFYSKSGDIFFGHFQDGWRHGRFLSIDVDGARWIEIWDQGVLVTREQLDSDASAG